MSDRTQALLLVFIQFVLFAVLVGTMLLLPADQMAWIRLTGIVITGIALGVVAIALFNHVQVNRTMVNISPEPDKSRRLVEVGIYRRIRHPLYLGAILVGIGAALAHGHWAAYAVAILLGLFFTYKSIFEERWLMRVYPGYASYRQHTGRFLPPVFGR